ncbi:MAG: hypothetical protein GX359_08080 [Clostridiales bacterium]|nr:hypothetical protein [Clostridiales bacterium]
MRKHRYWVQRNIKYVVWSLILLVSVYLLIRFAVISFSEDMGQASGAEKETFMSRLGVRIIEAGSGVMSYTRHEKGLYEFPINLIDDKFVLSQFTGRDTVRKVLAQETSKSLQQGLVFDTGEGNINNSIGTIDEEAESRIGFHKIMSKVLTMEYILTNGSLKMPDDMGINDELKIDILQGNVKAQEIAREDYAYDGLTVETFVAYDGTRFTLDQLRDINFLVRKFYIVDKTTRVTEPLFDIDTFLKKDMTIKQSNDEPQILIYHTHGTEAYIDSRPGVEEDSVIGVGSYLKNILEEKYGYQVIHDKTAYDSISKTDGRNLAYNYAKNALEKTLEKYPSIEVMIDLHRDDGNPRVTVIDGKETAQIMLFNGLSRDQNGPLPNHDNPNLQDNLAFSFQLQLKSLETHPGLFMRNYLKCYRYNLHLRPKSILMELGTVNNTVEQAKNAMEPFAEVLDEVLKGK